jgi:hypothetical protein
MTMGKPRLLVSLLVLGAALAFTGCDDNDDPPVGPNPDAGTPDSGTPDSGTPDAGSTELTDLARDLILNQTNETGTPTTTEDKNLVDSEPANAFQDSFFQ